MGNSVQRKNFDKEFFLLFTVMDENKSWLLDDNIQTYSDNPAEAVANKFNPGFRGSNRIASINGYKFGNLPGLDMCHGDTVSWHIIGIGSFNDVHNRKYRACVG